jgi:hypothetical protein
VKSGGEADITKLLSLLCRCNKAPYLAAIFLRSCCGEKWPKSREIDLSNGYYAVIWPTSFRFLGPRPLVEKAEALVREHIDRWQPTWHHWFHHENWNIGIAMVLGFMLFIQFLRSVGARSSLDAQDAIISLASLAVLAYLLAFMVLVLVGTKTLAPFIWFYRPGSPIEARRQ